MATCSMALRTVAPVSPTPSASHAPAGAAATAAAGSPVEAGAWPPMLQASLSAPRQLLSFVQACWLASDVEAIAEQAYGPVRDALEPLRRDPPQQNGQLREARARYGSMPECLDREVEPAAAREQGGGEGTFYHDGNKCIGNVRHDI